MCLFRRHVKLDNLLEVTNYFGRNSVTLCESEENSIYRTKSCAFIAPRFSKAGGTQIEYSTIVLNDVLVTGTQFVGASGGETLGVNYSFQAAKVEHHYWVQGKDGSKGAESQMGWDVKQNVATA